MNILNTKVHGVIDYLVGMLLIASPWLFGFTRGGAETWVPVTIGSATLLYSLLTHYERGIIRIIPMSTHLLLDTMTALLLTISPWLFGFNESVYLPHLLFGIAGLGVVLLSDSRTSYSKRNRPLRVRGTYRMKHTL